MRVWKKVPNVNCLASEDGKIRQVYSTIKRIKEEFERPQFYYKSYYYKRVCIHSKHYYVHKLVALAFLGPCPKGLVVDHIDNNRLNNNADNLRYITREENSKKASLTNPAAQKKFNAKEILEIKRLRKRGIKNEDIAYIYNSCKETIINVTHSKKAYSITD